MERGRAGARNLFDLHVHGDGSADSRLSSKQAMARARELGLRGLAFTDHDRLTLLESPFDDLVLVPGAELSTGWGDLLALGIGELPPANLPVPELIDDIHRQGGVAVVPHAFSGELAQICMNDRVYDVLGVIDGLEVTSPKPSVDNAKARRLAREHGKAVTGSSDAHSADALGSGLTTCEDGSVEGLLEAIRHVKTEAFARK